MSTCSSRPGWTIALLGKIGSAEADVPRQIFLGTLVQSVAAASLGAFLEGLLIIVNVGTAVALIPILERRNKPLALGHVSARLIECTSHRHRHRQHPRDRPRVLLGAVARHLPDGQGVQALARHRGNDRRGDPPTREFAV